MFLIQSPMVLSGPVDVGLCQYVVDQVECAVCVFYAAVTESIEWEAGPRMAMHDMFPLFKYVTGQHGPGPPTTKTNTNINCSSSWSQTVKNMVFFGLKL